MRDFFSILVLAMFMVLAAAAEASPLVYMPLNPSFGGNPSNGVIMLNEAQAQDQTHDKSKSSGSSSSSSGSSSASTCTDKKLCAFENALQSAILDRLSSDIVSNLIKGDGRLHPGSIDTVNFTIDVIDLGGNKVQVTTTSKATGQTETFVIDQGEPPI
jgi:curli production assembly/transport component CsgF